MKIGVVVLNFGEPEEPTEENVVPFLERIFQANGSLEHGTPEEIAARSRELARRRAPGLLEEYREIGGSPLNGQADAQARALGEELARRGRKVRVYSAFQFTDPLIADVVRQAREDGVERLIGFPVYPLCGHSTNVAALDVMDRAVRELQWQVERADVSGWHRHPMYLQIRVDAVRRVLKENGVDLANPRMRLVFSAHGTPIKYLEAGSRYDRYVQEWCRTLASALGVGDYGLGYQNHGNRKLEWTQPDIGEVIADVDADAVVVDPVSFMHEQSETLAELDIALREEAEGRGLRYFRVRVPHDDPRFPAVMADLLEPLLADGEGQYVKHPGVDRQVAGRPLAQCICRPVPGTCCLNSVGAP